MVKKTKQALVDELIRRRSEILKNPLAKSGLVDALIPLSSLDGEIVEFTEDGRVVIKFSAPIDAYIDYLTIKKIRAIMHEIDGKE